MMFVPQTAKRLVQFLERNKAFEQEGLFRVAPSAGLLHGALAQMQLFTKQVAKMGDDEAADSFPAFLGLVIPDSMPHDRERLVNIVASCYKLFFRRMTVPLVTPDVYERLSFVAKGRKRPEFVSALPELLLLLPTPHRVLLHHTLVFLRKVVDKVESNRMTSDNIARIFITGVFPAGDIDSVAASSAAAIAGVNKTRMKSRAFYNWNKAKLAADAAAAAARAATTAQAAMANAQDDTDRRIWMMKMLLQSQEEVFTQVAMLEATQLAKKPDVHLCSDEHLSECCHDANRWRFYFPNNATVAPTGSRRKSSAKKVEDELLKRHQVQSDQFDMFVNDISSRIETAEKATTVATGLEARNGEQGS